MIEKAINCKACGACTSLCKEGALQVDEDSVYVIPEKCTGCQECIKTQPFRGACIMRNYSPAVATLVRT